MSSGDSTDPMEAFKKAMREGGEAQEGFVKQFSNIQQDAMQNYFAVLRSLTFHNAMFKTTGTRAEAGFLYLRLNDRHSTSKMATLCK